MEWVGVGYKQMDGTLMRKGFAREVNLKSSFVVTGILSLVFPSQDFDIPKDEAAPYWALDGSQRCHHPPPPPTTVYGPQHHTSISMSPLGGWLFSSSKHDHTTSHDPSTSSSSSSSSLESLFAEERADILAAMAATQLLLNDDLRGAREALDGGSGGDSAFHDLGSAVTFFMASVLGFEKGVMTETSAKLCLAEDRAAGEARRAVRLAAAGKGCAGSAYPPGTEFELVRAQAQLMEAVVGVLHESVVEAVKGFYKLRKAYVTLEGIMATQKNGRTPVAESSPASSRRSSRTAPTRKRMPGQFDDDDFDSSESSSRSSSELLDAEETSDSPSSAPTTPDRELEEPKFTTSPTTSPSHPGELTQEMASQNPVDVFIHSGSSMCSGLIQLLLTIVPPAFARVLAIVGFRGNRARGLALLWRSAAYDNVFGGVAGLVLLAYYNGLLGNVDILPAEADYDEDAQAVGPPRERRDWLLAEMKRRYPGSHLLGIEESWQRGAERDLPAAIEALRPGTESHMKQVRALSLFELSENAMFIQDWALMRDSFDACVAVSKWSPGTYSYLAGCASLELYRDAVHSGDADAAEHHKKAAEEALRKAPTLVGRKKLMAKQLPFETFLQRKLAKWEARTRDLGVDLADAAGLSPAMEMAYMWNGQKRMGTAEMERAIATLSWSRCTAGEDAVRRMRAEPDEAGAWAVGMASLLRGLGRLDEAKATLEEHALRHERSAFRGANRDDYVLPAATYELGAIAWAECCMHGPGEQDALRRARLDESQALLEKVRAWEGFVLDARIGMRVQSGMETLRWFRRKNGW